MLLLSRLSRLFRCLFLHTGNASNNKTTTVATLWLKQKDASLETKTLDFQTLAPDRIHQRLRVSKPDDWRFKTALSY